MLPRLKIIDVERIPLHVPFTPRNQFWCAREQYVWAISEIIRITTDASGLNGIGETINPYIPWSRISATAIERVKGRNPGELLGDDTLGPGLQMAIYDLVGKAMDVPVYRLFNLPRVREWCPISWWNVDMSPEDFAAEAQEAVAKGYTYHKIKGRPWWDIFAQVEAIQKVTPPHYRIDMDWNQMLVNASNAAPVLDRLDTYDIISLYESPIMQRDIEGMRQLRAKIKKPLAIHFNVPSFPVAIQGEICDGFVIGGGIVSILEQAALCAAFDKPFFLQLVGTGITTSFGLQLGAALPMAQWPMINCMNMYSDDLLVTPLLIKGGYARVPDGPGLGIELDEEAVRRFKMEPPYQLPYSKQLLLIQWPDGRKRYYANIWQCWKDADNGNFPIHETGASLTPIPDDGTQEWTEIYQRAEQAPVFA